MSEPTAAERRFLNHTLVDKDEYQGWAVYSINSQNRHPANGLICNIVVANPLKDPRKAEEWLAKIKNATPLYSLDSVAGLCGPNQNYWALSSNLFYASREDRFNDIERHLAPMLTDALVEEDKSLQLRRAPPARLWRLMPSFGRKPEEPAPGFLFKQEAHNAIGIYYPDVSLGMLRCALIFTTVDFRFEQIVELLRSSVLDRLTQATPGIVCSDQFVCLTPNPASELVHERDNVYQIATRRGCELVELAHVTVGYSKELFAFDLDVPEYEYERTLDRAGKSVVRILVDELNGRASENTGIAANGHCVVSCAPDVRDGFQLNVYYKDDSLTSPAKIATIGTDMPQARDRMLEIMRNSVCEKVMRTEAALSAGRPGVIIPMPSSASQPRL